MVNFVNRYGMELLLNLAWIILALVALYAFLQKPSCHSSAAESPYLKSLIALGCVIVLLFPIVSASDDLHPTQAVLEEASKRIPGNALHGLGVSPAAPMLPPLFLYGLQTPVVVEHAAAPVCEAAVVESEHTPAEGRSPPVSA